MAEETGTDADLEAVRLTGPVRLAAAFLGAGGGACAVAGLQFVGMLRSAEAWEYALQYGLIAAGALEVGLGLLVLRMRHGAAIGAAILAPLLALASMGYMVLTIRWGVATCIAFVAPPLAGLGAIFSLFALAPTRRATLARKRLAASGLELGL